MFFGLGYFFLRMCFDVKFHALSISGGFRAISALLGGFLQLSELMRSCEVSFFKISNEAIEASPGDVLHVTRNLTPYPISKLFWQYEFRRPDLQKMLPLSKSVCVQQTKPIRGSQINHHVHS